MPLKKLAALFSSAVILLVPVGLGAQPATSAAQREWKKTLEAAKTEGKIVVSIPASAELRKQLEEVVKRRLGIEVEVFTARGGAAVRRMADEFKAGVRHFDVHIGGSSSAVSGLLDEGLLDSIEPWLLLPEVKDPKNWWGGHMWVDKAEKYIYTSSRCTSHHRPIAVVGSLSVRLDEPSRRAFLSASRRLFRIVDRRDTQRQIPAGRFAEEALHGTSPGDLERRKNGGAAAQDALVRLPFRSLDRRRRCSGRKSRGR